MRLLAFAFTIVFVWTGPKGIVCFVYLSSIVPLFQSESKCKPLLKITLIYMRMKLRAEFFSKYERFRS